MDVIDSVVEVFLHLRAGLLLAPLLLIVTSPARAQVEFVLFDANAVKASDESTVPPAPPVDDSSNQLPQVTPISVANEANAALAEMGMERLPPCPKKEEKKPPLAKALAPVSNKCGKITFVPGVRIQPRYQYEQGDANNDFFIRRFRLKVSGDIFDCAKYGMEYRHDQFGQFELEPRGNLENAWIDFKIVPDEVYFRVGLYDAPFSRDALTSDSKLLFMDRSLIKDSLTAVGMADNTVGAMLHGRPDGGRWEWYFGAFDNIAFDIKTAVATRESDQLMPMGRLVYNFLDPELPPEGYGDYMESYIGEGERLAVGVNAGSLGGGSDLINEEIDLYGWGIDFFYNSGPWVFQAEYDWFTLDIDGGVGDIVAHGWYAQVGYLFCDWWEFAVRYQQLDPDRSFGDNRLNFTSIGLNYYMYKHNFKIQTDYTFRDIEGSDIDDNVFEVQFQLDY
jgi:hypothetical protein